MAPRMPRSCGWLQNAGLVLLGVTLGLVIIEVGLRVASGFVGARAISVGPGQARTLLAVGDSHTYGVFFEAEEAYPGRLEALLAERAPDRYRVVNLGLPGMNSSEVVAQLPGWLERFQAHAVIVCVGVNNIWNRSDADLREGNPISGWLNGLRLVRFAHIAWARLSASSGAGDVARPDLERIVLGEGRVGVEHRDATTGELVIRHDGSFYDFRGLDESRAILRRDLLTMLELTRDWNSELVLLTYAEFPATGEPSPAQKNHMAINHELREFAAAHSLRLIDAAERFRVLLGANPSPAAYFHPDESHPNDLGYLEIARLVADAFEPL